ncbi:methyltransferase family protein [Manganibacter manganicus]|uniref:Isoprenylcysteine carboxyl methyltransferase n=1 Tax=Manganibacter manganicus TaxID=1873176 RepID=A0A1V8RWB3_9HYPH|nr:isoprenylcysteine carboxylmethyltransferase family protein [Pseudaminobacter manganicus]OQM77445.1 isoprenylcysteine carboxyl methyltransferase [Pseudaminobacter manganicus]
MTETGAKSAHIPWPPLISLAGVVISIVLGLFYPLPWIGGVLADLLFAIGGLMILATLALWFTAIRLMIRAGTTLNPTGTPEHFLTNGPFAVSRNPIYLGNVVLLLGLGLMTGNPWFLLLAFIVGFLTAKLAIAGEEHILAAKFGKRYRDYSRRVRRWI